MNNIVFREGGRVYLRPPCIETDLDLCVRWINNPKITRNLAMAWIPIGRESERKFLENANGPGGDIVCIIVTKEGNQAIGVTGLHDIRWKDRDATFGIFIGEEDQHGNGYGTDATKIVLGYAFQTLGLNRVTSSVWDFNEASIALHRRCGFQEEGRYRQKGFIDGQWCDSVLFGILRNEWLEI